MTEQFEPLYDRIAVEPLEHEHKTPGGIIIPDTAKDKPIKGKVVAVGHGYKLDSGEVSKLKLKVGDTVIYGKWGGTEVEINGKTLVVMKESDVMGTVSTV
jgi:chaperonin GroES